jgi:2-amino-4-hydroxy-6-hydroxymethyldihydropteridine diphosphokinase
MSEIVYIGLGSNLAEPLGQLREALQALAQLPQCKLLAASSFYLSDPLGPSDQPRYVNAVAQLECALEPLQLLDALQDIEQQQGRVRKAERWGPRTLDLDIVLFGLHLIDQPRLQVPHYHLHARAFVLYPLREIAGALLLPDGRQLDDLLLACPFTGLERLPETAGTTASELTVTPVTTR